VQGFGHASRHNIMIPILEFDRRRTGYAHLLYARRSVPPHPGGLFLDQDLFAQRLLIPFASLAAPASSSGGRQAFRYSRGYPPGGTRSRNRRHDAHVGGEGEQQGGMVRRRGTVHRPARRRRRQRRRLPIAGRRPVFPGRRFGEQARHAQERYPDDVRHGAVVLDRDAALLLLLRARGSRGLRLRLPSAIRFYRSGRHVQFHFIASGMVCWQS